MKKTFIHSLLLSLITVVGVYAQGKSTSINKVIAKVDNYYILRSELEELILQYKAQNQPAPNPCQALESLVVQKMLLAKAEIDSVIVEDKQVDNQVNARMEVMARRFGSEKNIVEAYGKSIEALKTEVREEIKNSMISEKMQTTITSAIKVTPSEVKRFFNSIPKDSLPYIPAEVEIGHIVRYAQVTKAQKEELRNRLLEFKARIEKGEDFASLASAYSEDIESAKQGGDLGFAQRGSMVPEYEGAALKLKINEISEPIESEYGLHLIQLLETRGAEYHSRHILLRPDYNRMDLSAPKRILDSLQHLIQIDSLKFEIAAKKWSEDKNTADAGGLLKEQQTGNSRLPLDASMDYNLYMMLDTMKVGTISAPLNYRTDDGKTAMRIVYYKSKIEPHTANLKDDFEKLTNIVLANKKTKAVDEWFKKAVTDVFINVEPEYQGCQIFGINQEGN
ncbi:peptidylprolyl isomerase [Runella sp. MFBS21]|uniref:peptidylprolyl isomerase n=1 Tax=Runella sp. MFBS21 TaxID=3034018 RepID=UPI0023F8EF99|nr:peptidylprolyl isomerase [Runella sp. MFBS21]MDF7821123.1 peptidylprolyl isomerase [Runella sp. MFBS21]